MTDLANLPLADMDVCFQRAGIPYVEVGRSNSDQTGATSWRTRGRPPSTGSFNPRGIVCHHTASPASCTPQQSLNVILWGNSSAPGPISQVYVSREPKLYLVAAGRANHAGKGRWPGGSCGDRNSDALGIEADNNGVGEPWNDAQIDLYAAVVHALNNWYGWAYDWTVLHNTTGPPCGNAKIDPAGPWKGQPGLKGTWDLNIWKQFCQQQAAPGPGPGPGPTPTPLPPVEDDDVSMRHPFVKLTGKFAIWHSNGVMRSWVQTPLNLRQQLFEASIIDDAGYNSLSDEQLREAPYVTSVGDLGGYGAIVGTDPGDV